MWVYKLNYFTRYTQGRTTDLWFVHLSHFFKDSDHYVCAGSLVEYPLKLRSQLAAAVTVQKFSHGISGSNWLK